MAEQEQPAEYGLVMPFVACQSQGGAYDDSSFVAGYEAATVDAVLGATQKVIGSFERWVVPGLVPQLDLIAMRHGYTTTSEPWDEHPEDYVQMRFEPGS